MCKWSASIIVAGLALGSLLLAGSPAGAQSVYAPPIDQREAYQQHRIHEGIDSGALTQGEARYLEREQGRIDRAEERMLADGNLSPRERERLNQMQNRAGRDIRRLENNNRTADGWGDNHHGWSGHTNSGWGGRNNFGWGGNTNDPRFDRREAYQQQLIHQGIESGSLTQGEARYLEREQGRIDRAEERMLADGNLSPRERQRLNQMQNQASRDIYRMENNNRTAPGYNGNQAGWQGHNRGWDGRDYGWQGNNPVGAGYTTGGNGYNHGWQGNNSGGGTTATGTTTTGTTQGHSGYGWRGNNSGGGTTTGGATTTGTTTAGTAQSGQGNYARNGQPGAYQQTGAQAGARSGQPAAWQGQGQQQYQRPSFQGQQPQMRPGQPAPWQGQQYQQARSPMPQTAMGPNPMMARQPSPMMARQPGGFGGLVNRANFAVPRRR